MSAAIEKQGERFIVVENGPGDGAFLIDLSESFGTQAAATAAAQRLAIPGGAKLIVLGIRFCATVLPAQEIRRPIYGSPRVDEPRIVGEHRLRLPKNVP